MSLLEDIFLGDEANEAQELERVIEGDEYDERRRSRSRSDSNSNSEKEDEAEEDKRRVDPATAKTKRVVKNPRQVLNPARLTGPRGISILPNHFKDFKFKGKGHEKEDLDLVLKKLEHWAYRLYPKFKFEDCLKKIETLGKKQAVSVHLRKIRSDQLTTDEPVIQKDSSDDEAQPEEQDEFDKLLQQQIDLARTTPAPNTVKKGFMTPGNPNYAATKATSSPSINNEQKERMLRNRKLAEERRLTRLKLSSNNSFEDTTSATDKTNKTPNIEIDLTVEHTRAGNVTGEIDLTETNKIEKPVRTHNRANIIDSSDEEGEIMTVNQSVTVDIHLEKETVQEDSTENENNKESVENTDKINISNIDGNSAIENEKDKSVNTQDALINDMEIAQYIESSDKPKINGDMAVGISDTSNEKSEQDSVKEITNPNDNETDNTNLPNSVEMEVDFNDDF